MPKVESFSVEAICHSTESRERVSQCILALTPAALRQSVKMNAKNAIGHYGNEITLLSLTLHGREAFEAADSFIKRLPNSDLLELLRTSDLRQNGSKVHIRVSKQLAYKDLIHIAGGDNTIKVTLAFKGYIKSMRLDQILKEAGLLSSSER